MGLASKFMKHHAVKCRTVSDPAVERVSFEKWLSHFFTLRHAKKKLLSTQRLLPQGYYERKPEYFFILFCLSLNGLGLGGLSLWLWGSLWFSGTLTHRRAVLCELLTERDELGGAWDVFTEGLRNVHTLLSLVHQPRQKEKEPLYLFGLIVLHDAAQRPLCCTQGAVQAMHIRLCGVLLSLGTISNL